MSAGGRTLKDFAAAEVELAVELREVHGVGQAHVLGRGKRLLRALESAIDLRDHQADVATFLRGPAQLLHLFCERGPGSHIPWEKNT